MDRRARVRLRDGRVVQGRLTCLDWQGNLLLSDASLEAQAKEDAAQALGVAIVPARHLLSCEMLDAGAAGAAAEAEAEADAAAAGAAR